MKKTGYKVFKICALVLAILIPLTVAFLMCRYTYKRHLANYEVTYFSKIKYDRKGNDKENYDEQIKAILDYTTYKYRLFASKTIAYDNDKNIGVLDIYEVIEENTEEDANGEASYSYDLVYYFVLHDINYGTVYRLVEGDDNATVPSNASAPDMYMQIRNADHFDDDSESTNYTFSTDTVFDFMLVDYASTPSKMGRTYAQVAKIKASQLPSNNIVISIHLDDEKASGHTEAPAEENSRYAYSQENSLNVNNYYFDLSENDLASFTEGFNNDQIKAGYNNYIFKTYWWWEALVTLVLVGALTGIFYMVLTYKESDEE